MLSHKFENIIGPSQTGQAYRRTATTENDTSIRFNHAMETAKTAIKILAGYTKPYTNQAIINVERYLNDNCPKDFVPLAVRTFNEHCLCSVVAVENSSFEDSIRLRVVSTFSDDIFDC